MSKYATISREEMEQIIQGGGSVIYRGAVITDLTALPTKAELAWDDQKAIDEARADLEARRKALDSEEAKLAEAQKARSAEATQETTETAVTVPPEEVKEPPEAPRRGR